MKKFNIEKFVEDLSAHFINYKVDDTKPIKIFWAYLLQWLMRTHNLHAHEVQKNKNRKRNLYSLLLYLNLLKWKTKCMQIFKKDMMSNNVFFTNHTEMLETKL